MITKLTDKISLLQIMLKNEIMNLLIFLINYLMKLMQGLLIRQ